MLGDCKGCKERRDKVNEFSRQLTERFGAWIRNPVGLPPSINQIPESAPEQPVSGTDVSWPGEDPAPGG